MNEFLGSVWWLIVTLGLLITFHEFGHFVVARRCGVKVLKFSVGFGKALWSRRGRDGTEFAVAAIPLGGYVKMLDEREGEVAPTELDRAFNRKPVLARMAIAAAGPVFNLVFAVAAFWLMFVVGKPDFLPIVASPTGLAATAGFEAGDRLTAIDGRPVRAWSQAIVALSEDAVARSDAQVAVTTSQGDTAERKLAFSTLPRDIGDNQLFERMGLNLKPPALPATVGRLAKGLPAAAAGIEVGDRIVTINGRAAADFHAVETLIPQEAAKNPRLDLVVQRGGERLSLAVTARNEPGADGKPHWVIGIGSSDPHDALLRYSPFAAIPAALRETWNITTSSLKMLKLMVVGRVALDNLSGPITIARFANDSAQLGLAWFLHFLGVISLSLAIMNLLPIPILDGGHLLYYLIELAKGSPVSERAQIAGQYMGLGLLVALMGLAFYNDILRLVS